LKCKKTKLKSQITKLKFTTEARRTRKRKSQITKDKQQILAFVKQ